MSTHNRATATLGNNQQTTVNTYHESLQIGAFLEFRSHLLFLTPLVLSERVLSTIDTAIGASKSRVLVVSQPQNQQRAAGNNILVLGVVAGMERKAAQKDPPQGGFVLKILQFG